MFDPQTNFYLIASVSVFIIFIIGFSIYVSLRIKTYEDYNVAGRNVSLPALVLTMMGTAIGGSTVLGFTTSGYLLGLGRSWEILPAYLIFILMLVFLLRAIRSLGTSYNLITIPDFTALRYGEKARLPSALALLFAYCAITGMQYTAIASFFYIATGLDMKAGIFLGWLILTAKTFLGGLKAVIMADSIQGTVQNLGILILFVVLLASIGGFGGAMEKAEAMGDPDFLNPLRMPLGDFVVFFFTLGAYQVVRQDVWQRVWAAKNARVAFTGFWVSTVFSFLITIAVFALGSFGRLAGIAMDEPALAFYSISAAVLPAAIFIIVITALMATIISCGDSNLVAGASSLSNDILRPLLGATEERKLVSYSRYAVLMTSLVALVLALYIPRLIELWVTGTAMLTSGLLFPVLAALYWKRATGPGGVTAIWGGLLAAVVWQLMGHPLGLHPVLIGLPVSFLLLLTVSLLTKPMQDYLFDTLAAGKR